MEQSICINCNKAFVGSDQLCDECRIYKNSKDEKMNKLEGTIEALAVMKSYKELRK